MNQVIDARVGRDGMGSMPPLLGLVGARFEKLILAGADDEEIGFVGEAFYEDGNEPVAGVGNTTAIDDLKLTVRIGDFKGQP